MNLEKIIGEKAVTGSWESGSLSYVCISYNMKPFEIFVMNGGHSSVFLIFFYKFGKNFRKNVALIIFFSVKKN